MNPPARTPEQRKQDTLDRLDRDVDVWVATAGDDGPYMVPLSFLWDGSALLLSTPSASPTGRNLVANVAAKTGFDPRSIAEPYLYFRVTPVRVQAWREVNELRGRDLMLDGKWTV
ncbi:MAG: pyridoxamine 5'-phosphate oxidase family protein [Nonomuraea sp.]|nr:pyridoxamine 5'-phosphate oxidase family protein [Nonomuraea sp.]